jgi:hypothetical protein
MNIPKDGSGAEPEISINYRLEFHMELATFESTLYPKDQGPPYLSLRVAANVAVANRMA